MKKSIIPIIFALLVGFFMTKYVLDNYNNKEELIPTFIESENLYFIQQGVYSSYESLKENLIDFDNYIYTIINSKYYAFIGITSNLENVDILKDYYKSLGYITYVKEFKVSNKEFLAAIKNYDNVLSYETNEIVLKTLINQVLKKYKEVVLNGQN